MEEFTDVEKNNATPIKVCLVGDAGVGKSNISTVLTQNDFREVYDSTIGVEFLMKFIRCTNNRNNIRKLQIWDTAGSERFRSISQTYLRGSSVMCLVYDVTDRVSFDSLEKAWIDPHLKQWVNPNTTVFLIANKIDLYQKRKVSSEEGEALAAKYQYHFMEISAKEGPESPMKLFQWLVDLLEMPIEERKKILMLETDDTTWTNKMIDLLKTSELFRNYSDLKIYEPIVKFVAPGLLHQEVIDWIVLNHDILTLGVIHRLVTAAHFFSFDKKGATVDNLVHLYMVSHACKFDLLGTKVVECLGSRTDGLNIEDAVKNSPKLIPNNSVVDLNEASMLLIERVHEYIQIKHSKKNLPARTPLSELWRNLIGQLYAERDSTGDFTVIVNTQHFKAHKVILARATSFFEILNDSQVRIAKDISNSAWSHLLNYFYTRDATDITDPAECLEILSVSSYLSLDGNVAPRDHSALLLHCEELVINSITDDTALDRLVAAENRGDLVDKKITMRYLVQNYERVYNKYETRLAALPKGLMFSLMSRVIQSETKGQGKL